MWKSKKSNVNIKRNEYHIYLKIIFLNNLFMLLHIYVVACVGTQTRFEKSSELVSRKFEHFLNCDLRKIDIFNLCLSQFLKRDVVKTKEQKAFEFIVKVLIIL